MAVGSRAGKIEVNVRKSFGTNENTAAAAAAGSPKCFHDDMSIDH